MHVETPLLFFLRFIIKDKNSPSWTHLIVLDIVLIIWNIIRHSVSPESIIIEIWHHHLKLLQKISIKRKALKYILRRHLRFLSLKIILLTTILPWRPYLSLNILNIWLKLISLRRPLLVSPVSILILLVALRSLIVISIIWNCIRKSIVIAVAIKISEN